MKLAYDSPTELHHSSQCFSSWRASLCFLEREKKHSRERQKTKTMCLASLPTARPVGPSWDLSRGQIFHTPPLIHACKNAPFPQPDTIPRPMNPGTAPNPPLLYKVGGDVWPWFVCLSLFFPQQCSTDPVCLNPLDVTLMDCRGGGWICVLVWRRSFRWEMFDAWSSRAARGGCDFLLPLCCGQ